MDEPKITICPPGVAYGYGFDERSEDYEGLIEPYKGNNDETLFRTDKQLAQHRYSAKKISDE